MPKSYSSNKPVANAGPVALLIGTRKGAFIMRSDKTRKKWKMADAIKIGNVVHHMVLDPRDGCTMLMTGRTGHLGPTVFRSVDYGKTWKEAAKPPAFPKAAEGEKGFAVDHNFWLSPGHASEPGVWYLGSSPIGLFRSEDGGASWQEVEGFSKYPVRAELMSYTDAPPDGATLHSIMIDPRDANHMYIGLSGGGVFETNNRGSDWHPLNKGIESEFVPADAEYGNDVHCMRQHPLFPDRLYQQNHEGIYRMDRTDGRWVNIGKNLPKIVSAHSYPIVVHPRKRDVAWVFPLDGSWPLGRVTPRGKPATYVTKNAGKTWIRQDKGMPKSNAWFTVKRQGMTADAHDPVGVYFGTTGGEVWGSTNEGNSWTRLAMSLPEIYSVEAAELPR